LYWLLCLPVVSAFAADGPTVPDTLSLGGAVSQRARTTLPSMSSCTRSRVAHVIRQQMAFFHHAFLLPRQAAKQLAQFISKLSEYCFLPVLRNEYNLILTLPTRVT
jgi:hypothetical protein